MRAAGLVRKVGNLDLYLDFLTEDPPAVIGARLVDDATASVMSELNRALACRRRVKVRSPESVPSSAAWVVDLTVPDHPTLRVAMKITAKGS